MTREELTQLRDAINLTLALPDSIREMLAQWLTPEVAKPNGHDPHPPVPTPTPRAASTPRPAVAKRKPHKQGGRFDEANARAAEQRLLEAIRERPDLTTGALALALGVPLSSTRHRIVRLADAGAIERSDGGGWRAAGEKEAHAAGEAPGPFEASPTP